MSLQALNDRVIVKVEPVPEKSIVTLTNKEDTISARTGIILSVGPTANEHNTSPEGEPMLRVGYRVYFNKYSGLEVLPNDESLKAISASELLAVDGVGDSVVTAVGAVGALVPN